MKESVQLMSPRQVAKVVSFLAVPPKSERLDAKAKSVQKSEMQRYAIPQLCSVHPMPASFFKSESWCSN